MDAELVRRIAFAAIAIPLALLIVWYGGLPLAALLAAASALGTAELFGLAERRGVRPARLLGAVSAAAIAPLAYLALTQPALRAAADRAGLLLAALWLIAVLTWVLAARAPGDRPLEAAGVTLLGVAYTGALPAFVLAIRHGQVPLRAGPAPGWSSFPSWSPGSATRRRCSGAHFGGPKLAPTVSPGKTCSGTVAGIIAALLVAPLFAVVVFPRVGVTLAVLPALAIAGVLSVVGQVGDLAESLFKREAGVKDSSHLIPGHGGVLDRLDSLYFVIPVSAAMYRAFGVI